MPASRPGTSLFRQLVVPVVGLVLAAVLANVGFAAWLAARRAAAAARAGQEQVAGALRDAQVALSPQVLDSLVRLTGSQFIVWYPAARRSGLSTLPAGAIDDRRLAPLAGGGGSAEIGGVRYRIGRAQSAGVRPETVLVLTPVGSLARIAWEAVWPVLAVAAATLAVLVPLSLRTTRGLADRIGAVERQVGLIAGGEFGRTLPAAEGRPADEIDRLVAGVNHMSATLATLRDSLAAGERQRLLGQLAAGFAHELRNAVTGAKLAIDLHRRRCGGDADDESLLVAARQLDILEEEVRGLLALGRQRETHPAPVEVAAVLAQARELTGPRAAHAGVRLEAACPHALAVFGRADALRAALVNLVLNAIDAAGRDGRVRVLAEQAADRVRIVVEDSGPGPPEPLRETLHEPFVTGKPEGIGLGLAIAKAVAEEHGGGLGWERADGWTRFAITLPAADVPPASPEASA